MDLLTLQQVADELRVSLATVEGWVRTKQIASFKNGHIRRIAREDLIRFVRLHTVKAQRPDWYTAALESDSRNQMRAMIKEEIGMVHWLTQQAQATQERKVAA